MQIFLCYLAPVISAISSFNHCSHAHPFDFQTCLSCLAHDVSLALAARHAPDDLILYWFTCLWTPRCGQQKYCNELIYYMQNNRNKMTKEQKSLCYFLLFIYI